MKLIDIVAKKYNISKRISKEYLRAGHVSLNNNKIYENKFVPEDNAAEVKLNINYAADSVNIDFKTYIIKKYEDITFLYKPSFIHTERHRIEEPFTLEDIISKNLPHFKLISRLDYQTDGLIAAINNSFKIYEENKHYIALTHGIMKEKLSINNAIDYKKKKKVKILDQSGNSITTVIPIKRYPDSTIVKIFIKKGLRHQIRAHLSYVGHPIYGDMLYGHNDQAERLMLSCYYVKINKYFCYSPYLREFYTQIKKLITV